VIVMRVTPILTTKINIYTLGIVPCVGKLSTSSLAYCLNADLDAVSIDFAFSTFPSTFLLG
jgi:hypothetical protein